MFRVIAILRPNTRLNEDFYFDKELAPIRVAVRTSGAPHRHAHGEEESFSSRSGDLVLHRIATPSFGSKHLPPATLRS